MTTRHMVNGLMKATKATSHNNLAARLAQTPATISRMYHMSEQKDMNLSTLDIIQQKSGVPVQTLMDWYRQPNEPKETK